MDLVTAQNTFAVRLYEWSQRDLFRELQQGCPLLSTVGLNNRTLAAFVMWNETLSSSERMALVMALTKRCHMNALRLISQAITEQDRYWLEALSQHTSDSYKAEHVPPLPHSNRYLPPDYKRIDPEFKPVNPDRCLDSLASQLAPIMGKVRRRKSKVICTRIIGDWKLETTLTFSRRDEDLSFLYQFIRKDGCRDKVPHPAQGPFPRTLLLFYGLSVSYVYVISEEDSEPMARVMAKLAEHFISQADPLFEGLGISD